MPGQRLGGHRAGSVGRYRYKPLCQRGQQGQHLVHILVCHNTDEKDELFAGEAVFQALHRGPHPVGVVAAVQQKRRGMPQQLKAARPAHRFQTPADGLFRDIPSPAPQYPQGRDGHGRVPRLVAADEGQLHAIKAIKIKGHGIQITALEFQLVKIHHSQRGVPLFCHPDDDGIRLRHPAVAHHRAPRFDDARLGRGNVRDGGAQLFHMIHAQRRDDRALRRVNDIGGVQRAAQTHLQHHDVTVPLGKVKHSQCRDDLKLGGHIGHGIGSGFYPLHQPHQFLVRDLLAVDLDPLIEAVDERRGVQAHAVPGRLQTGGQHGGSAALAVGARHMDKSELFVRVAQRRQQSTGTGQAGLVARPLHRVDVFQCRFVIHTISLLYFFTAAITALFSISSRSSTVFTAARISALGTRAASTLQA